ncbi:MAG: hypothetical protein ALAOOOJD_03655 [bacterium]|nr:hypothetical protein [bacterium]
MSSGVVSAHAIKIFGVRAQTRIGVAFDIYADCGNLGVRFAGSGFALDFEAAFVAGIVGPREIDLIGALGGRNQVARRHWHILQRLGRGDIGII